MRARREGNVARSGELGANLSFAAAWFTIAGVAPVDFQRGAHRAAVGPVATEGLGTFRVAPRDRAASRRCLGGRRRGSEGRAKRVCRRPGFVARRTPQPRGRPGPHSFGGNADAFVAREPRLRVCRDRYAARHARKVAGGARRAGASSEAAAAWTCTGELALTAVAVGSLFSIARVRRRATQLAAEVANELRRA